LNTGMRMRKLMSCSGSKHEGFVPKIYRQSL
jgi:hypothetical protein